jgi:hypothetical protein
MLRKSMRIMALGVGLAMAWLVAAWAVGPYMENERPFPDPAAGPAPEFRAPALPVPAPALAYPKPSLSHPKTVIAEFVRTDGEYYVLREAPGKQARLYADRTTRVEGTFETGDLIQAQVSPDGHALSIKPAPQ